MKKIREPLGIGNDIDKLVEHRQWQYDTAISPKRQRERWAKLQEAKALQRRKNKKEELPVLPSASGPNSAERSATRYAEKRALLSAQVDELNSLPIEGRYFPHRGTHEYRTVEEAPDVFVRRCVYCYRPEKKQFRISAERGPRIFLRF